jgi:phage terminase large subunit
MARIDFLPKQYECFKALTIDSPAKWVLFGGGRGGAKSFTGCVWQIQRRLKYPGTRGLIGRSKLDTLKKTTLKTFFEVATLYGLQADKHFTFNAQLNVITFNNGSEILLKDLFTYPSDPEFQQLQGLELTDAWVDEAAQVSRRAVEILYSCLRYKMREYDLPPKILLTCNPHKGWLYHEFYLPWRDQTMPKERAFVQSLAYDNPHLPESYVATLDALNEVDRQRLLQGVWEYDESDDALFKYDDVSACFRDEQMTGDMYMTCDVARLGKDRTVIAVWRGLQCIEIHELRKQRVDEVVRVIRELAAKHTIKMGQVIADADGVGGGLCDVLRCREFMNGSRAIHPDRFVHLKSECYYKLAEIIEKRAIVLPRSHRDIISRELDMIKRRRPEADGKLAVTSKEEISRMHGVSPDYADAIMMRMFFELRPNYGKYQFG